MVEACQTFRDGFRSLICLSEKICQDLSDSVITKLAQGCTNLEEIRLAAAPKLSNVAFRAILTNCKNIQSMEISGTKNITGGIKTGILRQMTKNPELASGLKHLRLWNHYSPLAMNRIKRVLSM